MSFDDSQPRDERGRWTSGGGSGSFPASATAAHLAASGSPATTLGTKREFLRNERKFVAFKASQGIKMPKDWLKRQAAFYDFKMRQYKNGD